MSPLKLTIILFPIAEDCIRVLAMDAERNGNCWEKENLSRSEVIDGLHEAGMIMAIEAVELQSQLSFARGCLSSGARSNRRTWRTLVFSGWPVRGQLSNAYPRRQAKEASRSFCIMLRSTRL
jgi:hypothetical protein